MIEKIRAAHNDVLLVDSGALFPVNGMNKKMRAELALDAMKVMDYDAVNISPFELLFGIKALRQWQESSGLPFLASNLVHKADRKPFARKHMIKTIGATTVAVLGIMNENAFDQLPNPKPLNHLRILPPAEALAALTAELKGKADIIVLLSRLSHKDTAALIADMPEITLAISGRDENKDSKHAHANDKKEDSHSHQEKDCAPYVAVDATGRQRVFPVEFLARNLGHLSLDLDTSGRVVDQRIDMIDLDEKIEKDPRILALKEGAYEAESKRQREDEIERARNKIHKTFQEELQQMSPLEYIQQQNNQNQSKTE
ncbi:MAG: hypothetical protein GY701_30115 [Sulfitobacter sp.]|nr:hypothetical protein [Sulfitobacter sp.]